MANRKRAQGEEFGNADLVDLTASIVSAYVSNNTIPPAEIPGFITSVSAALRTTLPGQAEPEPEPQKPAVPIRRSVTPEEIVCLECGRRFKSIRRHLSTSHVMDPDEYRQKWGLSRDYPMTAPNYAEKRSALAKTIGLGRKKGEPAPAAKGRGKRKAAA